MAQFMVERYLPGFRPEEVERATRRLRAAAAELAGAGEPLRYLGSTFVPEEESCFCAFEGDSREAVARVCERAQVPFARIHEVRSFERSPNRKGVR
jgi:hypothetical protein